MNGTPRTKSVIARARRWWAQGSPQWQSLVICGMVCALSFTAAFALAVLVPKPAALSLTFTVIGCIAAGVGAMILMMVRRTSGSIRTHTPGWYLKFQRETHARRPDHT